MLRNDCVAGLALAIVVPVLAGWVAWGAASRIGPNSAVVRGDDPFGSRAVAAAAPESNPPDGIELREEVQFGIGGGKALTLDWARPTAGGDKLPGIVFLHGGGWSAGSKNEMKGLIQDAARKGYIGASVGYRLAPADPFPAPVEDVKCAVRWMRAHAGELRLDSDRIGVIGFSAGAHLAMMLGVVDSADGLEGTGGWPDQSSRVQAVVAYAGPVDLHADFPEQSQAIVRRFIGGSSDEKPDSYRRASPITYVTHGDAPMLLFHGTDDPVVPYDQACLMAKALTLVKVPGRVELLLGAGHGWGGKEVERTVREGYDFLAKYLKP